MTREEAIERIMAIEALQEPKKIIGIDMPYGSDKGVKTIFKVADGKISLEEVEEIKPVKHGKWIPNENDTYSCSLCQSWLPTEQKEYARYCLYCGAKMDKEREE